MPSFHCEGSLNGQGWVLIQSTFYFGWGRRYNPVCKTSRSSTSERVPSISSTGICKPPPSFKVWLARVLLLEVFAELTFHSRPHSWEWSGTGNPPIIVLGLLEIQSSWYFGRVYWWFSTTHFISCRLLLFCPLCASAASKLSVDLRDRDCFCSCLLLSYDFTYTFKCHTS